MKQLFIILFFLFTQTLFAQKDGEWTLTGAGGVLMEHGYYKNQQKTGEWNYYYDDGVPSLTANYDKGILHGKSIRFDLLGKKIAMLNYVKGQITSEQIYYYSGEKVLSIGEMINGKENGVWKYYSPSGDQIGIVKFKDGVQLNELSKTK